MNTGIHMTASGFIKTEIIESLSIPNYYVIVFLMLSVKVWRIFLLLTKELYKRNQVGFHFHPALRKELKNVYETRIHRAECI